MSSQDSRKNPLYVVTEQGRTVQAAQGQLEAWALRLGLDKVWAWFQMLVDAVAPYCQSWAAVAFLGECWQALQQWPQRAFELARRLRTGLAV